jgi:phenylacetate-CoA ligase
MGFGGRMYDLRQSWRGRQVAQELLEKSQYWTAEEIEQHQFECISRLLVHCREHVPYYQALFKKLKFSPDSDFRKLSDLSKLPLLTKSQARVSKKELISKYPDSGFVVDKTSGSTGEPFAVSISNDQITFEKATVWRHWSWAGYRFRSPMAIVRTYVPRPGASLIKHDIIRNFRYYSAYHLNETNARDYLTDMNKFGAEFLRGYPSAIYILAKYKLHTGIDLPKVRSILTASETLTDDQRKVIQGAFRAVIFNWYGLAEQVVTANECEAHDGMHLNQEYGYWELEKRDYLPENQRMIVGTNFRNFAMPLLRYETGDIAMLSESTHCKCSRTLPLIKGIAGRKDDIITTPEGTMIPSVNFYSLFRETPSVERFQIIQWDKSNVEIRVRTRHLTAEDREYIFNEMGARLGQSVKLKLTTSSEFERNPEGKRRPVMSYVKVKEENETSITV